MEDRVQCNVEVVSVNLGVDLQMYGVVSEDGKRMTFMDMHGECWPDGVDHRGGGCGNRGC